MKRIVFLFIILCFVQFVVAQDKALTQTEYVKMLYALQKSPGGKADLIDALRRRGIDFVLTDGVRSLTRSKGANDEELKRALEEAGRRRENPVAAKLPTASEAADVLKSVRKKTLDAVDEMPDFVVKQQIQRSAAFGGTNNFRSLDRLVVAVSYRASGEESYRVLTVNGVLQDNSQAKQTYEETGGATSTGEFVNVLATIFKPESETKFTIVDTDVIRERKSLVFDFSITKDRANEVLSITGSKANSTIAGTRGRIWIDRENARVLRIESEATEIPETFPIATAKRNIDYDWVTIADEKYLLPSLSDVRLTLREKGKIVETRNVIRFKDYQKYGTDVKILDDDVTPAAEQKKP